MYGWKARIGLLIPSHNTTMEEELRKVIPKGVSIHTERMIQVWDEEENLKQAVDMLNNDIGRAVKSLATAKPDIIIYGCTGGSMLNGKGYEKKQSQEIQKITGIKSFTTTTAVMNSLQYFDAKKICVATPYVEELNQYEKNFLSNYGFSVLNIKGLGLLPLDIGKKFPAEAYRLATSIDLKESDAVFISCTNFRTIEIIDALEKNLGKPVISSNQATIWQALKILDISEPINGFGSLFSSL